MSPENLNRAVLIGAGAVVLLVVIAAISSMFSSDDAAAPSAPAPAVAAPHAEELKIVQATGDFDVAYAIDSMPGNLATDGAELLIPNLAKPWDVMRVRRENGRLVASNTGARKFRIAALTWNRTYYLTYDSSKFVVLDESSLRIISTHRAPANIACLASDGSSFWAATGNGADSLYQLDYSFQVLHTYDAPKNGCTALAWDGSHLWLADEAGAVHILDVSTTPRVVHSAHLGRIGGLAFFEGEFWVASGNRLQRLRKSTRQAWLGDSVMTAAATNSVLQARNENPFATYKPDAMELLGWSAVVQDGRIRASWSVWLGQDLFTSDTAPSYIVRVTKPDGDVAGRSFAGQQGQNIMRDFDLASADLDGTYRIELLFRRDYREQPGGQLELRK